jgi:hypothetical protein
MNNSPIIGALPNYRYIKGFLPSFPEDFYWINSYKHPVLPQEGPRSWLSGCVCPPFTGCLDSNFYYFCITHSRPDKNKFDI